MRKKWVVRGFILVLLGVVCGLVAGSIHSEDASRIEEKIVQTAQKGQAEQSRLEDLVVADFEGPDLKNRLGGESGSWNLDPDDPHSVAEATLAPGMGADQSGTALKLAYDVNSQESAQNGFWTKLKGADLSHYDHLQFDVRGDAESGFTNVFKVELKRSKNDSDQGGGIVKGGAVVKGVTSAWQTIQIPLNKMTGLINFADSEDWKNPAHARESLDEFVVVFEKRRVSEKKGVLYLDNIKFVDLRKVLPTAVDFPPRKIEKTPVPLAGLDLARFLVTRLQGYPKQIINKKRFPKNDRKFLVAIAKDTWKFFDQVIDREHQLPLDTIQLGENVPLGTGAYVGDYTSVTNIGFYFMCVVSAYDFKFISKTEAVRRINHTLDTLEKLEKHSSGFYYNYYDTTTLERTSYFVSLVDSGWLDAGLYVVKHAFPKELGVRASKILSSHSFSFFYDPVEEQMCHGYYSHLDVYSDYHYGSFYTEPRAISFMAIGRGEAPMEHWFRMVRTFPENYGWQTQMPQQRFEKTVLGVTFMGGFYEWAGLRFVPSWGGSMFEALMPALIVDERKWAPEGLGLNNERHVSASIQYTLQNLGYPVWGLSPSSNPEGGYAEYGVSILGSKGYPAGVVTPHASILALDYAAPEVVKNLRTLLKTYPVYGEYGFYDAVDVKTGKVAHKYLALDQGMILIALDNYVNKGAVRNRFMADPVAQKAEPLLREEKLFEEIKPERNVEVRTIKNKTASRAP